MSDGSKFTAVAQAVNEAKWLVDYHLEKELDTKLLSVGFLREDLFKYNRLRITERLEVKEKLLSDVDLLEVKRLEKEERNAIEVNRIFVNVAIPILEKHFKEEYPDWGKK
jgi:hypothetical protein